MKTTEEVRAYFTADGAEHFDNIVLMRSLGASPNIKDIGIMYVDIAEHAQENGLNAQQTIDRVMDITAYFDKLRGESSKAITNAMMVMTAGLEDYRNKSLEEACAYIIKGSKSYSEKASQWLSRIKEYGYNILMDAKGVMVFDYSSTVNAMLQSAYEHGKHLDVYIPESRGLDGGRPFVQNAIDYGHTPHFFPDGSIMYFLEQCDVAFGGAETFYPDGTAVNTSGTEMVAALCKVLGKKFYIPTTLIKVDLRGMYGQVKRECYRNLGNRLASHWPEEMQNHTDFRCPDLGIVEPQYITGFITELGIIPPQAMFQVSLNFAEKLCKGEC